MKALTISEAFRTQIGSRNVLRGFFSTYSFEADFFELEVLPLLLGSPALSPNETIRYHQLQSLMREHRGRWAVAYDVDVFDPQQAPRLEVDYLPIRVGGACQHAKLSILLVEGRDKQPALLLAAGSFNLTKAGWWENLEVGHWVELRSGYAPGNILRPLREALDFFHQNGTSAALDALREFASGLEVTADEPGCAFYFSGAGSDRLAFPRFLDEQAPERGALEVISPFFPEQGDNQIIQDFLARFTHTTVLLPRDEQGNALVDRATVYEKLPGQQVCWGQWRPELLDSHYAGKERYRRLHAKIYQMPSPRGWCFVGSVNLSYKAFMQNVEAGFLLKGQVCSPQLQALEHPPESFLVEEETPGSRAGNGGMSMPVIQLVYDWQESLLRVSSPATGQLVLLGNTENALAVLELEAEHELELSLPELREQLERSSLLMVEWHHSGMDSVHGTLLVSQRNLYCRPSHLPALDLQALLRIFQGMQDSARVELMADLAAQMIRLSRDTGSFDENLLELPAVTEPASFFSEFSQVNGAFWVLAKKLALAERAGDESTLGYYLKGHQPDSLRKVVASLRSITESGQPSLIVRYLTLLSVEELLRRHRAYADESLLHEVQQAVETLEREELLAQLQGEDKHRFIQWFRGKFFQPVAEMTRARPSVESQ